MKGKNNRTFFAPLAPAESQKRLESNYYVEGYATTFTRYLLGEWDGIKFYEEIAADALRGAEVSDVVFLYDHWGKVLARQSNGTLGIEIDSKGLFCYADLSKSTASRELYEEITVRLIERMSWSFHIAERSWQRPDDFTRIHRIERVSKIYDVSAVGIPANSETEISARNLAESILLAEQQERLELQKRKLQLKSKLALEVMQ